jgi:choline dehydrogenase-like flavoprotein
MTHPGILLQFPTIPHGNPAGVVMMMGEKIADLIKEDYAIKVDPLK